MALGSSRQLQRTVGSLMATAHAARLRRVPAAGPRSSSTTSFQHAVAQRRFTHLVAASLCAPSPSTPTTPSALRRAPPIELQAPRGARFSASEPAADCYPCVRRSVPVNQHRPGETHASITEQTANRSAVCRVGPPELAHPRVPILDQPTRPERLVAAVHALTPRRWVRWGSDLTTPRDFLCQSPACPPTRLDP